MDGLTPSRPLEGVRVVDMSTSYAGPSTSMFLADMGADVIKVERPRTGDDARSWGPPFVGGASAWFVSANRSKRSVCINLSSERGLEVLDRLLASAHVFIESMNPAKLEELGIDPDATRRSHPHLIYCALSGFGLTGPDRFLPGYDLIAQARSGMMSVTGERGGSPQRVSTALSDIATGMVAAFAIASAIRCLERTGQGTVIDVSLLDVDLALMAPRIASYLAGEEEPRPSGATDSVLAIYQTFEAADRPIAVAVGNDRIWERLCRALGVDDLLADKALRDNAGRRRHRERIVDRLTEVFRTENAQHWIAVLVEAGVPCSLVNYLSDVVSDEQVKARGSIVDLPLSDGACLEVVTSPWRHHDDDVPKHGPAPDLGSDTATVLAEVGYSSAEISELAREEAAWPPPTS